jgi:hypothetical protein
MMLPGNDRKRDRQQRADYKGYHSDRVKYYCVYKFYDYHHLIYTIGGKRSQEELEELEAKENGEEGN